jgi:hypothetical protein
MELYFVHMYFFNLPIFKGFFHEQFNYVLIFYKTTFKLLYINQLLFSLNWIIIIWRIHHLWSSGCDEWACEHLVWSYTIHFFWFAYADWNDQKFDSRNKLMLILSWSFQPFCSMWRIRENIPILKFYYQK